MIEMFDNPRMHELFVPLYKSQLEKTKRCLFGPPDPDTTEHFLREERHRQLAEESDVWGFDFRLGVPLGEHRGDFVWTPATPPRSYAAARPRKQRTRPAYDNSACYFQDRHQEDTSSDGYFKPISPVKAAVLVNFDRLKVTASSTGSSWTKPASKQTRITDFMVQKKRPALAMKEDKSAAERPLAKKARIAGAGSSS